MRVLFIENNENSLFSFRKELLDKLIDDGHEIYLATDFGERTINEYKDKIHLIQLKSNLRNINIIKNIFTLNKFKKLIKRINPEVLLTFTIKPNIYSNLKRHNAYSIANITGLGSAFSGNKLITALVVKLYKKSFKNVNHVMFQNKNGLNTFKKYGIPCEHYSIIPGSGVNLNKFKLTELDRHDGCSFLYASRFIKQKGIELLINAIPAVLEKHRDAKFIFAGSFKKYEKPLSLLSQRFPMNIELLERKNNIEDLYKKIDFLVSPSFYNEGISNVLLESLATGRPIITTNDNYGCKELLIEGKTGFGIQSNDLESLITSLNKACELSKDTIFEMGKYGHDFVSKNYSRKITILEYCNKIYNK